MVDNQKARNMWFDIGGGKSIGADYKATPWKTYNPSQTFLQEPEYRAYYYNENAEPEKKFDINKWRELYDPTYEKFWSLQPEYANFNPDKDTFGLEHLLYKDQKPQAVSGGLDSLFSSVVPGLENTESVAPAPETEDEYEYVYEPDETDAGYVDPASVQTPGVIDYNIDQMQNYGGGEIENMYLAAGQEGQYNKKPQLLGGNSPGGLGQNGLMQLVQYLQANGYGGGY